MQTRIEKDAVSGRDTTGNDWDGVKELNTPLPTWWVYTFWATVVFAVAYCALFPSGPWINGHTSAFLRYSSRSTLTRELADEAKARSAFLHHVRSAPCDQIRKDPEHVTF